MQEVYRMRIGLAVIVGEELPLIDNFFKQNRLTEVFSEIRVVCDKDKDGTITKLRGYETNGDCVVYQRDLNLDFAKQRNYLNGLMESEYILRLDVDEIMNEELITWIKEFKGTNDVYIVKRQEKFEGVVNTYTPIIFLYKNKPEIQWHRRIHEVVAGYNTKCLLDTKYLLVHDKNRARCERQNNYYYKNFSEQRKVVDGIR